MSPSKFRRRPLVLGGLVALSLAACGGAADSGGAATAGSATSSTSTSLAGSGSAAAGADASQPALADSGFRPDKNGIPFENYGTGPSLTEADVRTIYGDGVCAGTSNGSCLLTEQARAWMDGMNKAMGGGHCYGFSVLALQLYKGTVKPSDLGASSLSGLTMSNAAVTSRISIDWVAQTLPSVQAAAITGTPNAILDKLVSYFQSGASSAETYTLRIFNATGGHAITPFAAVDKGNGKVAVLAYDNNFPGVVREAMFDRTANSYEYNSAANPSEPPALYNGNIDLFPTTPGEGVQPCPFCGQPAAAPSAQVPASAARVAAAVGADPGADRYYEVFLDGNPSGHAHLVFTDGAGHHTGIVNGAMVAEVPGVTPVMTTFDEFGESAEPVYDVKVGARIDITIDGTALTGPDTETLDIVGPGIDAQVQDIQVAPGQKDVMTLSADGTALGYTTTRSETPVLELARQDASADWAADLKVHGGSGGSTLLATLTDQALGIGGAGDTAATYDLQLTREDGSGSVTYAHSGLALMSGDIAALEYTQFAKHGDAIAATVTTGGQTQQQSLADQS